ncbi:MAG: phosphomannomutase/phosphoglucomutase [Myxococcales bacterium]|nr:phosphomannomutase/phosphoglucomutase [Myxococcales bacterium]
MNPQIFREYDIRGKADRDLSDDVARDIGRALGSLLAERGKRRIMVGRDCRVSSRRLRNALVEGLVETGRHVVKIEVGPTPLLYFAVHHLDADGGVMVTGSHNPPEDNGFKILAGKGTLHGDEIRGLRDRIARRDFVKLPGGHVERAEVGSRYVHWMRGNVRLARTDLKVVVDAGNGAGGPLALATMRALGLNPDPMYCEMDGRFPNHHPDPTLPENVAELIARVRETGADLGIAFDGDADRLGAVDSNGEIIWGDKLMVAFGRAVLARHPGAAILGEVKCSQTLYDDIAAKGGRPIMWKTGHSLIKAKMKEEHALLAGEMSGHLFFADRYFGYDDAIYAALRLLEIVAASPKSLAEELADLPPTFVTPEIRVDCPDELKFKVVEKVLAHYQATHPVADVDGARVNFGDGWGLVRASNTQAVLVLRFEANSEARRDALRAEVEAVVAQARESFGG